MAISSSVQLAAVISSGFYSIWFLFAGFLIPQPRMPVWWKWYSWLDPGASAGCAAPYAQELACMRQAPASVWLREWLGPAAGWTMSRSLLLVQVWRMHFTCARNIGREPHHQAAARKDRHGSTPFNTLPCAQ